MRLLNVRTLDFQEFHGNDLPPYVITSHRWVGDEITYEQFRDREVLSDSKIMETAGFKKIMSFCEFMRSWGRDVSCPSRHSDEPNFKGDCGQCFSRRFKCDQQRPKCSNCSHDRLACEYNILRSAWTSSPVALESEVAAEQPTPRMRSNPLKSCKACATANRICSKDQPACTRCQQHGLECDYSTALAGNAATGGHEQVTNLDWIWIDTCCIDKRSSAELGEAINSMFRWYAGAYACLAYMQDVRGEHYAPSTVLLDFKKSSWFTRGWTLQELLAPNLVVFLNQDWNVFGHKAGPIQSAVPMSASKIRMPLNPWISRISGIKESILLDYRTIKNLSMDERLVWMDGRTTTRLEDRAYCLLGICDVFMPLIYGEGERACDRLEEIINKESGVAGGTVYGLRNRLMHSAGHTRDEIMPYAVLDAPMCGTPNPYISSAYEANPTKGGLIDPNPYNTQQYPHMPGPYPPAGVKDYYDYPLSHPTQTRMREPQPLSPQSAYDVNGLRRTVPRRERDNNAIDSMMGADFNPRGGDFHERRRGSRDLYSTSGAQRRYGQTRRSTFNPQSDVVLDDDDTASFSGYSSAASNMDSDLRSNQNFRRAVRRKVGHRSRGITGRRASSSTEREVNSKPKGKVRMQKSDQQRQSDIERLEERVEQLSIELEAQKKTSQSLDLPNALSIDGTREVPKPPSTPAPKQISTGSAIEQDSGVSTPSRKPGLTLPTPEQESRKYRMVLEEIPESIDGVLSGYSPRRLVVGKASPVINPRTPGSPLDQIRTQNAYADRTNPTPWSPPPGYTAPPGTFPQWPPASPNPSQGPPTGTFQHFPTGFGGQPNAYENHVQSAQRQCVIM